MVQADEATDRPPRFPLRAWLPAVLTVALVCGWWSAARSADLAEIRTRRLPGIEKSFVEKRLRLGAPIFLRVFKAERRLELWVERDGRFALYRDYPICFYSGALGPKLREGDRQSPEGFYFVTSGAMNPASSYHLSFNLGYPNAFDRANRRTGSLLMVHGSCVSLGCYAMTDPAIEEIYLIAEAAFAGGQRFFRVHAFPFRMTDEAMAAHAESPWIGFWRTLKPGHDFFEKVGRPPNVTVRDKAYVVEALPPGTGAETGGTEKTALD